MDLLPLSTGVPKRRAVVFRTSASTYDEVIADLSSALAWLEAEGIRTHTKRHAAYLAALQLINRRWHEGAMRADEIPIDSKLMETAAVEAFQLARIWRVFRDSPSPIITRKLRTLAGGPILEGDENVGRSGNSARNCALELEIASYFRDIGEIDLGGGVDVVGRLRTMPLYVECKRPASKVMLPRKLREAEDQIMGVLSKTRLASYGIPALSVVKADWPGGVVIHAKSQKQLRTALRDWIARVDEEHLGPWFKQRQDQRLAAVLIHLPYVAQFADSSLMAGVELGLIGGCRPGSAAHFDMADLGARLSMAA